MSDAIALHLSTVTQNPNKHFFRVMLTYYYGVMASHMRVGIHGWGDSTLPINIYSVCLSESGTGKGFTMNTVNGQVINGFRDVFIEETFPVIADDSMITLAQDRATRRGTDEDKELEKIEKEFADAGELMFQFSEGTPAAAKQIRHKFALANAGSLNFIVDEIGTYLITHKDMFPLFLEMYDTGSIEDKLVKNTSDNKRVERVNRTVPTNMLLVGTSSSLLDGSETEAKFFNMLETGYARRCFFSFNRDANKTNELSAEQLIDQMFDKHHNSDMGIVNDALARLADINNVEKGIVINRDAAVYLMQYKLNCIQRSAEYKAHQKVLKLELDNRFFKVLKLASAYAFIDGKDEVTKKYLNYAITLAEESGEELHKLMSPEKDFMKLAKFLVDFKEEATVSDMELLLPCFNGSKSKKDEMINSAISWGYKNGVLITKKYVDQILFLQATTLEQTNLDELIISISDHTSEGYEPMVGPFEDLEDLGNIANYQWCNHHFDGDYRLEENVIPGFNLLVLDIDDGTPLSVAKAMFSDYWCAFYETKSSEPKFNRYRIILPISHVLELNQEDYSECIRSVIASLPFNIEVDDASAQRSKKWRTCDKGIEFNDARWVNGEEADPLLFDILPYIPRSSKNDERIRESVEYENLDRVQRWFVESTCQGNRNKQLYRYAMILVDMGLSYSQVEENLLTFNSHLRDSISDKEIKDSILKTVAKKIK